MRIPSFSDTYQVLVLQAADEGRGPALFGESLERARKAPLPFLVGERFPDIYHEFPLAGAPYLDVTLLYGEMEPGTRVDSPAAGEHGAMLDWYAAARNEHSDITCGFELDTNKESLPVAAVHFQPRSHVELVRPFCEAVGEPERADLYQDLAARMPKEWPLSFFGMFRGRPNTPLRVCGYLDSDEKDACASDPRHLASVFDEVGFSAYDDSMLQQVAQLMSIAPDQLDFQFDVYEDGRIGDVFAIDIHFGVEQPESVRKTFSSGVGADIMEILEGWGAADSRWRLAAGAAFARSLPVELEDGSNGFFAFTIMPQWAKARWANGKLQPSKLYLLSRGATLDRKREN